MHIFFTIYVSSLCEIEDSLPPGKAILYTWADPVGSRKLKWRCGESHGEVTQKDVCTGLIYYGVLRSLLFIHFLSYSLSALLVLRTLLCFHFLKTAKDF